MGGNKRKRFFPGCRACPGPGKTLMVRCCAASRSDVGAGCVVFRGVFARSFLLRSFRGNFRGHPDMPDQSKRPKPRWGCVSGTQDRFVTGAKCIKNPPSPGEMPSYVHEQELVGEAPQDTQRFKELAGRSPSRYQPPLLNTPSSFKARYDCATQPARATYLFYFFLANLNHSGT